MNWYVWGQSSSAQPPGRVFQKAKSSLGSRQLSEDPGKEHHGSPSLTGEEAGVGEVGCRGQGLGQVCRERKHLFNARKIPFE